MKRLFTYMLILALPTTMLVAQAEEDHDEARRLLKSGEILSLEVILDKIRPRYPGKVIKVELEQSEQQLVYEVELVGTDGVVYELYIDPKTGEVLRSKVED